MRSISTPRDGGIVKPAGPKASPVRAGECGLGALVTVRTEVSRFAEDPTDARALRRVPARTGLIREVVRPSHNPEFNGYRVGALNIPARDDQNPHWRFGLVS